MLEQRGAAFFKYASIGSYLLALVAVLFGSLLLALIKPKNRAIPREAVIGILYAMALVISLLLTDKLPDAEAYVTTTLSGSLLWVTWPLVSVTAVVYIVLLIFHYIFRDTFITLAETPQVLKTEKLWDFLFFTTQGIITVLIVPITLAVRVRRRNSIFISYYSSYNIVFIYCTLGVANVYRLGSNHNRLLGRLTICLFL